jgi:hypothetical protein
MMADMIGAFIMAVIAFVILSKHDAKHVASSIRLGKKNIDTDE